MDIFQSIMDLSISTNEVELKTVSNNEVAADLILDQAALELRKRDRKIMNEQCSDGLQIVSIGTPKWVGERVTSVVQKPNEILWDFESCGLPYNWTHYGVRGEGVNVFVLDTGIDMYHPAFLHCNNQIVAGAKSFVSGITSPQDGCGHGTWVAGKIVGAGVGLAPACNLYSLRVLDDSGTGRAEFTNDALSWLLHQETPHIINMSLGSPNRNIKQEKLLWQLHKKGSIIIVAAGNGGDDDRFYPAAYSGVMAIAAVDKRKTRAEFSNYGANIAVSAPGVACYSSYLGGGFRLLEGTSMASPTVAGLVTLGVSLALSKGKAFGVELRDLITSSLQETAEDLGAVGRDPLYGFGCIDGRKFMEKLFKKL